MRILYIIIKALRFSVLAIACIISLNAGLAAQDDLLIKALQDEMERGLKDLRIENEKPPYFLGYIANLEYNCKITAGYGSVIDCNCDQANQLFLDLRVGNYDFDNANVVTGFLGAGMDMVDLPTELNYDIIRKIAWLQMDAAYKGAVETLAGKRAILQSMILEDTIADLSQAEKVASIENVNLAPIDTLEWKDIIAKMSHVFNEYPQFKRSSVQLNTKLETRYLLNSEGTVVRRGRQIHYLVIEASALDKNGLPVYQYDRLIVDELSDFPDRKTLLTWAEDFAAKAVKSIEAETIDNYIGPVIFTPRAAAQIFNQLFVENISDPRKPLTPDGRLDSYLHNPRLAGKIGFRVLPDFLSVVDDPTLSEYQGMKLHGFYKYDDQGVPAERIALVEDGKLKSFYMSRTPTKKIAKSNGHGRMMQNAFGAVAAVGKPGNVILSARETYTPQELQAQMLDLCLAADLEQGLVIDLMDFSGNINPDEGFFRQRTPNPGLPQVLNAYLVSVKDGSLRPVRGLEFENVNERALKDILAAGNDFRETTIMFDKSFNNLASIVIPSLLFEELELKKTSTQSRRAPYVLSPLERGFRPW